MRKLFLYVFIVFLSSTTLAMAVGGSWQWRWETTDVKRGYETCRFNGTKSVIFDLSTDHGHYQRVCVFNCPLSSNLLVLPKLGTHVCEYGDSIRVDDSHKGF